MKIWLPLTRKPPSYEPSYKLLEISLWMKIKQLWMNINVVDLLIYIANCMWISIKNN